MESRPESPKSVYQQAAERLDSKIGTSDEYTRAINNPLKEIGDQLKAVDLIDKGMKYDRTDYSEMRNKNHPASELKTIVDEDGIRQFPETEKFERRTSRTTRAAKFDINANREIPKPDGYRSRSPEAKVEKFDINASREIPKQTSFERTTSRELKKSLEQVSKDIEKTNTVVERSGGEKEREVEKVTEKTGELGSIRKEIEQKQATIESNEKSAEALNKRSNSMERSNPSREMYREHARELIKNAQELQDEVEHLSDRMESIRKERLDKGVETKERIRSEREEKIKSEREKSGMDKNKDVDEKENTKEPNIFDRLKGVTSVHQAVREIIRTESSKSGITNEKTISGKTVEKTGEKEKERSTEKVKEKEKEKEISIESQKIVEKIKEIEKTIEKIKEIEIESEKVKEIEREREKEVESEREGEREKEEERIKERKKNATVTPSQKQVNAMVANEMKAIRSSRLIVNSLGTLF